MLHTFILIHCDLKSLATCDLPPVPHGQFDGDCSDVKVISKDTEISQVYDMNYVESAPLCVAWTQALFFMPHQHLQAV